MSTPIISVENLSKRYRLGVIGATTLRESFERWWHRARGRDPDAEMGVVGPATSRRQSSSSKTPRSGAEETAELWALRDVSFEVQRGEVLGIIGRNGAGKSTLLKILCRITEPTRGRAILRGRVGSLLEVGTGFHPELTGRENVYLNGAILGMRHAEITKKFDEIVDFSGVERFVDTPVKRYSSGMTVRLAFAVAAHLDPEILLVDEVLAVGDAEFQKKCLGKMGEVAREGRTVLFVSHNMAAVRSLCGQVLMLADGMLLRKGKSAEMVSFYMREMTQDHVRSSECLQSTDGGLVVTSLHTEDSQGNQRDSFGCDESVAVVMDLEIRHRYTTLVISVDLYTEMDEYVFSSCLGDDDLSLLNKLNAQTGRRRAKCIIPSGLLNQRRYFVGITAQIPNVSVIMLERKVYAFSVVNVRRKVGGGMRPGIIRPSLQWCIDPS